MTLHIPEIGGGGGRAGSASETYETPMVGPMVSIQGASSSSHLTTPAPIPFPPGQAEC